MQDKGVIVLLLLLFLLLLAEHEVMLWNCIFSHRINLLRGGYFIC